MRIEACCLTFAGWVQASQVQKKWKDQGVKGIFRQLGPFHYMLCCALIAIFSASPSSPSPSPDHPAAFLQVTEAVPAASTRSSFLYSSFSPNPRGTYAVFAGVFYGVLINSL
eukprot:3832924-Rhodomonas_salina.1